MYVCMYIRGHSWSQALSAHAEAGGAPQNCPITYCVYVLSTVPSNLSLRQIRHLVTITYDVLSARLGGMGEGGRANTGAGSIAY